MVLNNKQPIIQLIISPTGLNTCPYFFNTKQMINVLKNAIMFYLFANVDIYIIKNVNIRRLRKFANEHCWSNFGTK